jgi:hypothetical protein
MKNTDPTLGTSKEVVLDNSALKAGHMYPSHEQSSVEKDSVQEGNKSLETVGKPNIWRILNLMLFGASLNKSEIQI